MESPKEFKTAKATREGLVGKATASGYVIDIHVPFVALPSTRALGRFVEVFNPWNSKKAFAVVLDVGPWNTKDDQYVFGVKRPQAESGVDLFGRRTNKAGIDLGEKIWNALGMTENSEIGWRFIDE